MEITEEKREMTLVDEDGKETTVECRVITTEDGVDENGNPKRSVEIKVPANVMGMTPGEVT